MPRGSITKDELKVRILKLKHALHEGRHYDKSHDWNSGAHDAYNTVLDLLDEYAH
jgi:hypothetical protein